MLRGRKGALRCLPDATFNRGTWRCGRKAQQVKPVDSNQNTAGCWNENDCSRPIDELVQVVALRSFRSLCPCFCHLKEMRFQRKVMNITRQLGTFCGQAQAFQLIFPRIVRHCTRPRKIRSAIIAPHRSLVGGLRHRAVQRAGVCVQPNRRILRLPQVIELASA